MLGLAPRVDTLTSAISIVKGSASDPAPSLPPKAATSSVSSDPLSPPPRAASSSPPPPPKAATAPASSDPLSSPPKAASSPPPKSASPPPSPPPKAASSPPPKSSPPPPPKPSTTTGTLPSTHHARSFPQIGYVAANSHGGPATCAFLVHESVRPSSLSYSSHGFKLGMENAVQRKLTSLIQVTDKLA